MRVSPAYSVLDGGGLPGAVSGSVEGFGLVFAALATTSFFFVDLVLTYRFFTRARFFTTFVLLGLAVVWPVEATGVVVAKALPAPNAARAVEINRIFKIRIRLGPYISGRCGPASTPARQGAQADISRIYDIAAARVPK